MAKKKKIHSISVLPLVTVRLLGLSRREGGIRLFDVQLNYLK